MLFILAKTEWPSLGELISEYLFTPGYSSYTPGITFLSFVLISLFALCLTYFYLPGTPYNEESAIIIFRICIWTKSFSALSVPLILETENTALFVIVFSIIALVEHFILRPQLGNQSLALYTCVSAILSMVCAYMTYTWAIFCILSLLVCVITFIWLIHNDKLFFLEEAWSLLILLLIFIVDGGE